MKLLCFLSAVCVQPKSCCCRRCCNRKLQYTGMHCPWYIFPLILLGWKQHQVVKPSPRRKSVGIWEDSSTVHILSIAFAYDLVNMRNHEVIVFFTLLVGPLAQKPDEGYSREQLQPLTNFRQQHRRTIDGRLCAAAFVQNRKSYTGCTDAPNPTGESGRPWCYVEAQARCFLRVA